MIACTRFLRAGFSSRHPTNNDKALKYSFQNDGIGTIFSPRCQQPAFFLSWSGTSLTCCTVTDNSLEFSPPCPAPMPIPIPGHCVSIIIIIIIRRIWYAVGLPEVGWQRAPVRRRLSPSSERKSHWSVVIQASGALRQHSARLGARGWARIARSQVPVRCGLSRVRGWVRLHMALKDRDEVARYARTSHRPREPMQRCQI